MDKKLLSIKNLKKNFLIQNKILKAVDDVSFDIIKGKTFAIVGESGCGKSSIANMIANLIKPTSGQILFENRSVFENDNELKKNIQMIFQDPYLSLNPKMKISEIILEPIKIHKKFKKEKELNLLTSLLNQVNLSSTIAKRYPHELSGGQRQRIAIARSIALNPKFIICDEPLSSLDISTSSQIINLLKNLQQNLNLSYLFISHNLAVVKYISQNAAVMYLGKFLELAPSHKLFLNPLHPYTQALISASFSFKKKNNDKVILKNEIPSLLNPPKGCLFSTRCPYAKNECFEIRPTLKEVEKDHQVACHLVKTASN